MDSIATENAQRVIDRLADNDDAWTRAIRLVQIEVVKSTVGVTDWEMPDDIAEDVICAVVRVLVEEGAVRL